MPLAAVVVKTLILNKKMIRCGTARRNADCLKNRQKSIFASHLGTNADVRSRIKPSWQTEAMSVPSRVNTLPRQNPRAPWLDGLSWA
jgi:hypothetical protein